MIWRNRSVSVYRIAPHHPGKKDPARGGPGLWGSRYRL